MCGIAGKLYFHKKINREKELALIFDVQNILKHRGPDHQGFYFGKDCWLISDRLSIIDLTEKANQPVLAENGKVAIVFNGEIYNYREIKDKYLKKYSFKSKGDAEVILTLYQEKGLDCLKYLRGMFAFAIWDGNLDRLFIARDRIGKKPLKYYFDKTCFIFASELKAILKDKEVKAEPDWQAIGDFLTYGYIPATLTGFKGIYKLPPASYLTIDRSGRIDIKKYWQLDLSSKLDLPDDAWQDLITDKLRESVKIRLVSDVPLGIHLSGGIDSSIVTALASQETATIKTFSVGFHEESHSELKFARQIATIFKTEHREVYVKPEIEADLSRMAYYFEEPFADPSLIPTWYLMEATKGKAKVVLNGDGGDENFAGYPRYLLMKYADILKKIPLNHQITDLLANIYRYSQKKDFGRMARFLPFMKLNRDRMYREITSFINSSERRILLTANLLNKIRTGGILSERINGDLNMRYKDPLEKYILYDIESYLSDNLMAKTDLASMAHSLEVRSPFLDHEFMELTAKMPVNLKLNGFTSKYLLKKIAGQYLPKDIVNRRKRGFLPPLNFWLKGNLLGFFQSELFDKKFIELNLVNPDVLKQFVKEHEQGFSDHSYLLFVLLMLREWFRVWYNN